MKFFLMSLAIILKPLSSVIQNAERLRKLTNSQKRCTEFLLVIFKDNKHVLCTLKSYLCRIAEVKSIKTQRRTAFRTMDELHH